MKILIIEDEVDLRETIKESLEKEHFIVETAGDYTLALDKISIYDYDCILLDIMLPNGNGLDLLEELKNMGKSENVIIISAKNALDDKVRGLALGADDYLTKPFHLAELNARVKAVLRRKNFNGKETVEIRNVILDIQDRTVKINTGFVHFNNKEFNILKYFMSNKNRLVTKTALAEYVWGDDIDQADNFDFIYYQIKNLRKKLEDSAAQISLESIYGVGYKLTEK